MSGLLVAYGWRRVGGGRFLNGAPARVESGPDSPRPRIFPPTLGEHWSRNLPRDVLRHTFLLRLICATVLRRATVCAISRVPHPGTPPPTPSTPRTSWGSGFFPPPLPLRAGFSEQEPSPRVAPAEGRCAGAGSWTRGNLATRHAAWRVVEQSDKNGWQKLDKPQPGQVHPRLIGPAAVGARMSSGEPT